MFVEEYFKKLPLITTIFGIVFIICTRYVFNCIFIDNEV